MLRIIATIAATLAIAIVFGTTMFDDTSPSNDAASIEEYKSDGRWAESYDKWVGLTADRESVLGTYSIDENGDTNLTSMPIRYSIASPTWWAAVTPSGGEILGSD
jgi:hypothetical protein